MISVEKISNLTKNVGEAIILLRIKEAIDEISSVIEMVGLKEVLITCIGEDGSSEDCVLKKGMLAATNSQ